MFDTVDVDTTNPMRFCCDTRSKDEVEAHYGKKAHDGLLNRYLGFRKEDRQRIIELFAYLRIHWNNPGHHYGQKRKMELLKQY